MEDNKKNKEIDLAGLAIKVLMEWKTLICFVAFFAIIGLIVAFNKPKEYTASVILAPEISSGGLGLSNSLSDMASSFGIDLGSKSTMDAIYPEIYPDIFASSDFMHSLFDVKVRLKDDNTERTYYHHITKEMKVPFWNYPKIWLSLALQKTEPNIKGNFQGDVDPYRMPKKEFDICQVMSSSMLCFIDKTTSEITISVTDQDPMVAAIMADTLQRRLQAYITDYRTKKARADYDYYDKLMKEAEASYNSKKGQYAGFTDSHRNSVLESVSTQQQSLQNNMTNAYDLFSSIQKMRDQAKAKIQERTPAFTMIQTAKMPYKPSSTPKALILLIFIILGVFCDVVWLTCLHNLVLGKKE